MLVAGSLGALPRVAMAGIGDPTDGHRFTVVGAIQTPYMSTVVQCAHLGATGSAAGTMTVEFFDQTSALLGTASTMVAPGALGTISTMPVASQPATVPLGIPNGNIGAMRVLTDIKKLRCRAFITAPTTAPGYISRLPVLAKGKQRGD
jgi:hypothetical protein